MLEGAMGGKSAAVLPHTMQVLSVAGAENKVDGGGGGGGVARQHSVPVVLNNVSSSSSGERDVGRGDGDGSEDVKRASSFERKMPVVHQVVKREGKPTDDSFARASNGAVHERSQLAARFAYCESINRCTFIPVFRGVSIPLVYLGPRP